MSPCTPQQQAMWLAARRAGMRVSVLYLPGAHDWRVWGGGLLHNLAWLDSQPGITGGAR